LSITSELSSNKKNFKLIYHPKNGKLESLAELHFALSGWKNVYRTTTAGLDRVARFFIDLLNWIFVFFLYGIIAISRHAEKSRHAGLFVTSPTHSEA
jgi:hypothetical protein